jgi:hypothetical protein
MNGLDPFLVEKWMQVSTSEQAERAKARSRARTAGVRTLGGVRRQAQWLACRIGYALVALNAWLERVDQPSKRLMQTGGWLVRAGLPAYVPARARVGSR